MLNISKIRVNDEVLDKYRLHALSTLSSPKTARTFAKWIQGIVLALILILFLPWQQNISGTGSVTALDPEGRPQTIQNIIGGRIEKWYVQEGAFVEEGDTLLVISEVKDEYFDPEILKRYQEQIQAKREAIEGYKLKINALNQQLTALRTGLDFSLQKMRNKITQSRMKVVSDSTDLLAFQKNYEITQSRLARYEDGFKDGLFSLTDLESRRLKIQEEAAKLISQQNKLDISRQEFINARIELNSITADYQDKIAKANSDRSSALSSLADGESELSKLINKYASIEVRQGNYVVRAPQSGFLVKAMKAGIGETIKEGESVATLQPDNSQIAVEVYVNPMDVALVSPGREVRLEFDGWPALQFAGWPGVSVGTFGGTVSVIDQVNSANGKFRLLVVPKKGEEWPAAIRQGSGVYGWVMLSDVPVWYEIWRQLNGFPPNLNESEIEKLTTKSSADGAKK
ncbi:HlyD family secretion protein [Arundinibacter roseus]|uniref:HlyD family efflux transporter periplasmic adaptor subunit n=1 Tax=Arundinibacter roseus TaxID=2070510 RepID=A0A4R4KAD3_9BACT|nr:HlyD family efflux transporter periplasmic adaptor subunit [Arundinibacter roseus]TDB64563.1 HlyD family efflux transporter periplasmic adaptor subunit [Arundinibacter roseus]